MPILFRWALRTQYPLHRWKIVVCWPPPPPPLPPLPSQSPNWVKVCLVSTVFFLPISIELGVENCLSLSVGDNAEHLSPCRDFSSCWWISWVLDILLWYSSSFPYLCFKGRLKIDKAVCEGVCHSKHSSIMIFKVLIWFMRLLSEWNPGCFSLRNMLILSHSTSQHSIKDPISCWQKDNIAPVITIRKVFFLWKFEDQLVLSFLRGLFTHSFVTNQFLVVLKL